MSLTQLKVCFSGAQQRMPCSYEVYCGFTQRLASILRIGVHPDGHHNVTVGVRKVNRDISKDTIACRNPQDCALCLCIYTIHDSRIVKIRYMFTNKILKYKPIACMHHISIQTVLMSRFVRYFTLRFFKMLGNVVFGICCALDCFYDII